MDKMRLLPEKVGTGLAMRLIKQMRLFKLLIMTLTQLSQLLSLPLQSRPLRRHCEAKEEI